MKILLILTAFILHHHGISGQSVQYSSDFEEPRYRHNKLFQCSNGNTILFSSGSSRNGMSITLYDTSRRVIAKKAVVGRGWDAKEVETTEIKAICEIDQNPVLFIQQEVEKRPSLFRVVFDKNTGVMLESRKIAEMEKYTWGEKYALSMGGEPKNFHVVKDEFSDCYAVIKYDGLAPSPEKAIITVTHYDGNHNEINEAGFKFPAEYDYKFLQYLGMAVDKDKNKFLITYAFDTRASGGKRSMIFFSKLTADTKSFVHNPLEMTENFKKTAAALRYNRGANTIDMLLLTLTESKSNYMLTHTKITEYYALLHISADAATFSAKSVRPLQLEKAAAYNRTVLNGKKEYFGLPLNFAINQDFSSTVTLENMREGTSTHLNDLAIIDLNRAGEEENAWIIRKQQSGYIKISPFEQYYREKNAISGRTTCEYFSYNLVSTATSHYVIFNDLKDNFSKLPSEKLAPMKPGDDAQIVCHRITNGEIKKFPLFDELKQSKNYEHRAIISSSNFRSSDNTYAVLLFERKGREKKARIAWVQFE